MAENKDELYPDEDIGGIASIDTVLKDKPKKESKPKIKPEQELYNKIEKLWNSISEGSRIGNLTRCRRDYEEILRQYKDLYL